MSSMSNNQSETLEILDQLSTLERTISWDGSDMLLHYEGQEQSIVVGRDGSLMWGD